MKKHTLVILLILLISFSGCTSNNQTVQVFRDEVSTIPTQGKLQAIDCKPEQRNPDGCIEIYQPVCGQIQIQCITTPCDPISETFENSCKACANPNVISYTEGECIASDNIKR